MGSKLVSAAFAFVREHNAAARAAGGRELEALEVALLVLMAHTAVDEHADPAFWVKRSEICAALGIRDTEAGRKRVQRAVGALAVAGAIAVPRKYFRGQTPRYRLIYQGGCQASTETAREPVDKSTEVWTPGIPLTGSKGDAQRPEYGRLASPGVDAWHPLEEGRGTKEEGGETKLELTESAPSTPPPWDHDLPQPTTAREAARCPKHPHGTSGSCWACGDNRQAWIAEHPSAPVRRPKRHRYDCKAGRHRVSGFKSPGVPDDVCGECGQRGVTDAYNPAPIGATA